MKPSFVAVLLSGLFICPVLATDTNVPALPKPGATALLKIGALDATNHYDQVMIVTGTVVQVTIRPTVTFLNLDRPFPDSLFTVVIFHGHSSFYGDANALKGKSIEIEGKITRYHDKPEIALDRASQLTVPGASPFTNAPVVLPTNAPPVLPATNFPEIM